VSREAVIASIAADLVRIAKNDARLAASHLPLLLFQKQIEEWNDTALNAASAPARMAFALASAALGFVGDELPPLFDGHAGSYEIGLQVRISFDDLMSGGGR
jgi:hypothetical protein